MGIWVEPKAAATARCVAHPYHRTRWRRLTVTRIVRRILTPPAGYVADGTDCNDADPGLCVPTEVRDLIFMDASTLAWSRLRVPGGRRRLQRDPLRERRGTLSQGQSAFAFRQFEHAVDDP